MTSIAPNPNFAALASPANVALAGAAVRVAAGITANFFKPLMAGPYAFANLPAMFALQGGTIRPGTGNVPTFIPAENARWSATMQNESEAKIDLGDGYRLELDERNSEIRVYNDTTGETTRIWGDPHVEVDGKHAFDFWGTTTFTLENGTKITIDTEQFGGNPNEYVASQLTITKGDQAIVVDGISQNEIGDLEISMSNDGRMLDFMTRDGFVLNENATGAGWRSEWTGDIATQQDLDATKVGALYGPGSDMPSLGEISRQLSTFLFFGFVSALSAGAQDYSDR